MHVVLAADAPLWPGVAGAVASVRAHSALADDELRFHLVTAAAQVSAARRALACFGIADGADARRSDAAASRARARATVVGLPESWLAGRLRVVADPAVTGHLASPLNFARFYLPRLLPSVRRLLYLDSDVIAQADVALLWRTQLPAGVAAAAVPRHERHFRYARYARACGGLFAARRGVSLNSSAETFNAGVLLLDLAAWEAANLTAEAEWWMAQHAASPGGLWSLGSQPILHLALHGRWAALPERWNLDGLGRVPNIARRALESSRLLHWTGRRKPWLADGLYRDVWRRHVPDAAVTKCADGEK